MRRLNVLLVLILITVSAYSQNNTAKTDPKADTKTENTDNKTGTTADKTGEADKKEGADGVQNLPEGYGNLTWGVYISDAKDKIAGTLTYTDDKTVIVSKENELQYYYGFFYKEPAEDAAAEKKEETGGTAENQQDKAPEKDEGRLFYVSMNFPYLDKDKVYEKIEKKYGKHTGEDIKDNQGAIAWDSENTVVIMWIDRYEKKPYCRRIIYISKKISLELNEYTNTIFNKTELNLLKNMKP